MKLFPPLRITERLMVGVKLSDGTFISINAEPSEMSFTLYIDGNRGVQEKTCIDAPAMWTGQSRESRLVSSLEAGLDFLVMCGASYKEHGKDGDCADLFSERVARWAAENLDEIGSIACDMEANKPLIERD